MSVARVVQKASGCGGFKSYSITTGGTAQKALKTDADLPHKFTMVITNDDATEPLYVGFDNTTSSTHKTYPLPATTGFVEIAIDEGTDVYVNAATNGHLYTVTMFRE